MNSIVCNSIGFNFIGFDSSLLSQIKTDNYGVELWRTSNSLYIIDRNGTDDAADDLTIQILDEGGRNPELERDENFPGGSRKVEGYAVEKSGDGQYTLALKITEEFSYINLSLIHISEPTRPY